MALTLPPLKDNAAARGVLTDALAQFRPIGSTTVEEWSSLHRWLGNDSSGRPGLWKSKPWQREMQEVISDPKREKIVIVGASQSTGKTEIELNTIGWMIDVDPGPALVVVPTKGDARTWARERLNTMIRDCPRVRSKIRVPRGRRASAVSKAYDGGNINVIGANVAGELAMRPVRYLIADELDRWARTIRREGSPLAIVRARMTTFEGERKEVLVSSPTIKGLSLIWDEWEESDQRHYYVPCPHCGAFQWLKWTQVKWARGEPTADEPKGPHLPSTAYYECEHCSGHIDDRQKHTAVNAGEWIAENPDSDVAGFHLSALYSEKYTWAKLARKFLEVKDEPEKHQAFVNTVLAELWEGVGAKLDGHALMQRREPYEQGFAPAGVLACTAGVDVQDDRLECEIVGWGRGEESWSLRYEVLYGNPAEQAVWDELDRLLLRRIHHESGAELRVVATAIDTGGHYSQDVYQWVRTTRVPGVLATKGASTGGRPIIAKKPTELKHAGVKLWLVGTDTAKSAIYNRLALTAPEAGDAKAGYCHFPGTYEEEYFRQLTAEKRITQVVKGRTKTMWVQLRERNEALDCRVLAYVALRSTKLDLFRAWKPLAKQIEIAAEKAKAKAGSLERVDPHTELATTADDERPEPHRPKPTRRRKPSGGGWGNNW